MVVKIKVSPSTASQKNSYYRPDIDGLRALAVLSGLLFQARVPGFASGFVSVDIFFVISGFLITSIILRQIRDQKFSFRTFYLRRFRRILPALAVMLIGTIILSSFVLIPDDFRLLGRHIVATILLIPNISIWRASADYFAPTVDANPLLDLWSLGVEEQFYLLTPGLLFLLMRYASPVWIARIVTGLLAGSLALTIWLNTSSHTSASYYLSPPRAWELLCGVGLAYYHFVKPTNSKPTTKNEWLAGAALTTILLSVIVPSGGSLGIVTLTHQMLAVLSTTLLIHLHRSHPTRVARLLSGKFLVSIGLISYPLYLWRWPLFSLRSYLYAPTEIPWYETLLLLILCFLLSYLTWRWVEKPARSLPIYPSKSLIKWTIITQLVLLVVGLSLWHSNGLSWRFSSTAIAYLNGSKDVNPLRKACLDSYSFNVCSFSGTKDQSPQFMVLGSSQADALVPVSRVLADKYSLKGIQVSSPTSPFLIGVKFANLPSQSNTKREEFNLSALKIAEEHQIKNIFLPGLWSAYIKSGLVSSGNLDSISAFKEGMEKAVSLLVAQGKRVWIVLEIPPLDRSVPRWLALHAGDQSEVWTDTYPLEKVTSLRPFFDRLSKQYGVTLLDPLPRLCRPDGKCIIANNGKAVYSDQYHLSASGSMLLEDMLRPAFEVMKSR
jgi:peptidoglycan/LPS O-acetylase OafA/YrhL